MISPRLRFAWLPVDLELRERRRRRAAHEERRRAGAAIVLALLAHLVFGPLLVFVFTYRPSTGAPKPAKVEYVQIPAAQWDAMMGAAPADRARAPLAPTERPPVRERPEEKPEPPPGQVVETAPGNGLENPDARFAAESSNRVEKETIARDRRAGEKVTMPRQTTSQKPVETPPSPSSEKQAGEGLALGAPGEGREGKEGRPGNRLEIPSIEKQDRLKLKTDPAGEGAVASREESDEVRGNSDRFRLEVGDGEEGTGAPSGIPGGGKLLQLFPSQATLDKVTGGPAPDHVVGVEEGEGTFLNTREWKYASFFNRVKRNVSETWDPVAALRRRDPTGEIYAWKDRHTLLTVVLAADGSVADIYVERSSGVDFLDREAIAAFERAQPFPNPPRGLVDAQGQIRFQFGFFLETGRSGFRIFR